MKAVVRWDDGVSFVGRADSGHDVVMDGSPEYGGQNKGSRPMELILMGLGGCASFDVVTILKKARQDVVDVSCELQAKRAETIPAVFTAINLHFVVKGRAVKPNQVEKAIHYSADKYCSASKMLSDGGVIITHSFEVVEVD